MDDSLSNIPSFIAKLWKMLNQQEAADVIFWNSSGKSFAIQKQALFMTNILPLYFKHNNISSFIRQLNLYDFHKISKDKCAEIEYQHEFFQRDKPDLLKYIRRKSAQNKKSIYPSADLDLVALPSEITLLKRRQNEAEKQVHLLHQENVLLQKEISDLQVQFNSQNQILKKIFEIVVPFVEDYSALGANRNEAAFNGLTRILEHGETSKKSDVLNKNALYSFDGIENVVPSIEYLKKTSYQQNNNQLQLYAFPRLDDQCQAVGGLMETVDNTTANIKGLKVSQCNNRVLENDNKENDVCKDDIISLENELSSLLDDNILDDTLLNSSNNFT